MFRNLSLVTLVFVVLGTAPVDAQLFRRLRKAVQQNRQVENTSQHDQQKRQQQQLSQSQKGTKQPTQQGSAPKQGGAGQSNQAQPTRRYSLFQDRKTGRANRRPDSLKPNQKPASPKLAKGNASARPDGADGRSVGQVDIARQATDRTGALELKGPESNSKVRQDSNVVPASNSIVVPSTRERAKTKKPFSILEPDHSGTTEPKKSKPTISVLELTGPDKSK